MPLMTQTSLYLLKVHEHIIEFQNITVEGFDGHSVSLKVQKRELERFKEDQGEGFGKVK